jgi:hypothetical protein
MSHSYREANYCVDVLAMLGYSLDRSTMFYGVCHSHIKQFLLADTMGIMIPRLLPL